MVQAFIAFDQRLWPSDSDELAEHGDSDIKFLLSHYAHFFRGDEAETALEQWVRLKVFIMKNETLRSMKFKDLWPRFLSKFSDTYEVVCRLVVFMLLFVLDNSEMERLFSLMNKIKGKFQYWMDHEVLRDCIWWNKSKKLMSAQQWDNAVNRIGQEWQKGTDTKSGKCRAHTAAPLIESSKAVNVAQSAASGTQN